MYFVVLRSFNFQLFNIQQVVQIITSWKIIHKISSLWTRDSRDVTMLLVLTTY